MLAHYLHDANNGRVWSCNNASIAVSTDDGHNFPNITIEIVFSASGYYSKGNSATS